MHRVLTRRIDTVMAAETVIGNIRVVKVRWRPGHSGVAVIAVVTAAYMFRVLTRRDRAVVTGTADSDDLRMVHHVGRRKHHVVMAVLTNIAGLNVFNVLAKCIGTVMAAKAIIRDVDMIEIGWYPGLRCVAIITGIAARDMQQVFSGCSDAVMAGIAGADNLCVINSVCWRKNYVVVAILAEVGRLNVHRRFSGRRAAIVASRTIRGDADVIESRRHPAVGCVAVIAVVATTNMCCVLANGYRTVVAIDAGANHMCVIHTVGRYE